MTYPQAFGLITACKINKNFNRSVAFLHYLSLKNDYKMIKE